MPARRLPTTDRRDAPCAHMALRKRARTEAEVPPQAAAAPAAAGAAARVADEGPGPADDEQPGDALALVPAPEGAAAAPLPVLAATRGRPAPQPARLAGAYTQAFLNLLNGVGFLREPTAQPRTKINKKEYKLTLQARACAPQHSRLA